MWGKDVENDFQDGYDSDFSSLDEVLQAMEDCNPVSLADKERHRQIFERELKRFSMLEDDIRGKISTWNEECLAPEEMGDID